MNDAQRKLVEENTGIVFAVVSREFLDKCAQGYRDEMVSIGNEALCRSAIEYDASKGVKYCTFAWRCVENAIRTFFRGERKRENDISLEKVKFMLESGDDITDRLANTDLLHSACDNVKKRIKKKDSVTMTVLNGMREGLTPRQISDKYGCAWRSTSVLYSKLMYMVAEEGRRLLEDNEGHRA